MPSASHQSSRAFRSAAKSSAPRNAASRASFHPSGSRWAGGFPSQADSRAVYTRAERECRRLYRYSWGKSIRSTRASSGFSPSRPQRMR